MDFILHFGYGLVVGAIGGLVVGRKTTWLKFIRLSEATSAAWEATSAAWQKTKQ